LLLTDCVDQLDELDLPESTKAQLRKANNAAKLVV
jgi:hypothetical protein